MCRICKRPDNLETPMAAIDRITELVNASNPKCPEEELQVHYARAATAAEHFRHDLNPAQRAMLLSAASASNLLFLALASGEWEKAVRALRGYVARSIPRENWSEYRELIVALSVLIPNELEGEVVVIRQPQLAAAAA
jgi:hypothetical protein